jgi:hypothetical protein
VQKALHYANEECEADGGGAVTFALDTVRKLDLNGDGRDDYIISFADTKCADHETAYCGTGGCVLGTAHRPPCGTWPDRDNWASRGRGPRASISEDTP